MNAGKYIFLMQVVGYFFHWLLGYFMSVLVCSIYVANLCGFLPFTET